MVRNNSIVINPRGAIYIVGENLIENLFKRTKRTVNIKRVMEVEYIRDWILIISFISIRKPNNKKNKLLIRKVISLVISFSLAISELKDTV